MTITRNFKLCLNAGTQNAPYINVNQYDEGEEWVFTLYNEDGSTYTPSSGAIIGIKSDGNAIMNAGSVVGGKVVITETEQMTAASGRAIFELLIDNATHGTANFIVNVEQRPGDNADLSDSDLSLIQEAVDSAAVIVEVIGDSDPSEVIGEHVDAWLDAHPEATTTVQDGAITIPKLNDSVKNGTFENMIVGTAQAVLNDEGITDKVPYKYRVTGGGKEVGNRALDTIVGGTVAWNQLNRVANGYSLIPSDATGLTISVTDGWLNISGTPSVNCSVEAYNSQDGNTGANHVCLMTCDGATGFTWSRGGFSNNTTGEGTINKHTAEWAGRGIVKLTAGTTYNIKARFNSHDLTQMFGSTIADYIYSLEQANAGAGVAWFKKLFPKPYYEYDAGTLKSVEGLTSHDMVGFNQWDEEWEVGTIGNTGQNYVSDDRIRSKNYIHVIPNTTYYITIGDGSYYMYLWGYDADKNYVGRVPNLQMQRGNVTMPNWCHYIRFAVHPNYGTTYKNDICINLSWDGQRNGEYEPYEVHSYPLDSSLTLRGIPKLDSNNNLYYDGDVYTADGKVQRKYAVVDLGTLTWVRSGDRFYSLINVNSSAIPVPALFNTTAVANIISTKYPATDRNSIENYDKVCSLHGDANARYITVVDSAYSDATAFKNAMSGVYLVYELATPTTEQADPYQHVQIIDPNGTEEYVSTSIVPVGHITEYPTDIVAKVNALPKDFSTLIAPTEKTFTATRNYTVNDLLIINNVLYKVTTNIANGATITPNSNVTQTTLSALIKALS